MPQIYVCDTCHFLFERSGEIDRCPDCGKQTIRLAAEAEQKEYHQLRLEFSHEDK